jgi:flavorubredoxin
MFPLVSAAIAEIVPLDKLRWITFGHVEADECGSMNEFLEAAPEALVAHGRIGCMTSLDDLCLRPPHPLDDGDVLELGGKRVRHIDTPHVPHNWESRMLFEETTRTLFCGDLFTHPGDGPPVVDGDLVEKAMAAEDMFHATALSAHTAPTIRRLAELEPRTLAIMHGSSFVGDGAGALRRLADAYEQRMQASLAAAG